MSIEKYALVSFIFDKCITTWKLKGYNGLSIHLGVPYQTLMAWKKRGSIGDYAPFLDKGISREWLKTGEGPMFAADSVKTPDAPYEGEIIKIPPGVSGDDVKRFLELPKITQSIMARILEEVGHLSEVEQWKAAGEMLQKMQKKEGE